MIAAPAPARGEDWRELAACTAAPELMFPDTAPAEIEAAKDVCAWGGRTGAERHALYRQARAGRAAT